MKISDMDIGQKAIITKVDATDKKLKRVLMDRGLTIGTVLQLQRVAPLGDPRLIKVRGCSLAIRADDTQDVRVKPIESEENDYEK